jgi:hypothetical protein
LKPEQRQQWPGNSQKKFFEYNLYDIKAEDDVHPGDVYGPAFADKIKEVSEKTTARNALIPVSVNVQRNFLNTYTFEFVNGSYYIMCRTFKIFHEIFQAFLTE